MTPSQLKYNVELTGSFYFTRKSMKFFGDTMRNYGVISNKIKKSSGDTIEVWELFRMKPVNHGLNGSVFFSKDTYKKVCGEALT